MNKVLSAKQGDMTYLVPNASSNQAVANGKNVKKYFQKRQLIWALRCEGLGELEESAVHVTHAASSESLHLKSELVSHHLRH